MSLPSITYPFDPTGRLPSNLVNNDQHVISQNNYKDFYFVVPKFAPFFIESIVITYNKDGVLTTLVEGVDYYGCLPFIGASRSIGKPVYGGISFSDLTLTGAVSLRYQTVGGPYLFDDQAVLENIANASYNPRIVTWEQVTNKPDLFPPTNHEWNLVDQVGQSAVVDALVRIEQAILTRVLDAFNLHMTNVANPHSTNKAQIGLDLVENFPPASLAEAKALLATNRLITPATLKSVLDEYNGLKLSRYPGNLIKLKPDGIYFGIDSLPTSTVTPLPTPAPTQSTSPVFSPMFFDLEVTVQGLLAPVFIYFEVTLPIFITPTPTVTPITNTVWDAVTRGSSTYFPNNDNKVVSTLYYNSVRATVTKSTGKSYFEIQFVDTQQPQSFYAGLTSTIASFNGNPTSTNTSWLYYPYGATLDLANGASVSPDNQISGFPDVSVNQVVGFAVDHDIGLLKIFVDNVLRATKTISSIIGIPITPMIQASSTGESVVTYRLCTNSDELNFTPPTGYDAWDNNSIYNEIITITPQPTIAGQEVTLTITGGMPYSTCNGFNPFNGNQSPATFDSDGNYTTNIVLITSEQQGTDVLNVPLEFTFLNGRTRTYMFASNRAAI